MKVLEYVKKPCLDAIIEINGKRFTYKQKYGEINFIKFFNENRCKWK